MNNAGAGKLNLRTDNIISCALVFWGLRGIFDKFLSAAV